MLRQRMEQLLASVRQDALHRDDVEVQVQLDQFNVLYGVYDDAAGNAEQYLVPDLTIFFERFDDVAEDHNSDVDAFWDVMNEHYQQ